MKYKYLLCFMLLPFFSCGNRVCESLIVEKAVFEDSFQLSMGDRIEVFTCHEGKLFFELSYGRPIYRVTDKHGNELYNFGRKGHGKGEFLMPELLHSKDSVYIYDCDIKQLYSVADSTIVNSRKIAITDPENGMKILKWPYVGYYVFRQNTLEWKLCHIDSGKNTASLIFCGESYNAPAYLQSFDWDACGDHVVFAQTYYDAFRICMLSDDMHILSDNNYSQSKEKPTKEKAFYTGVVCSSDRFFLLSQRGVQIIGNGVCGESEIEVYDYHGNMMRKIKLGGIFSKMSFDMDSEMLYLLKVDDTMIKILRM